MYKVLKVLFKILRGISATGLGFSILFCCGNADFEEAVGHPVKGLIPFETFCLYILIFFIITVIFHAIITLFFNEED